MKYLSKLFLAFAVLLSFMGCKKIADLPFYPNGTAVVLTSSTNTISTAPADSSKNVLTLSWSNPKYAQDSSLYKFVVEIDSTGRNFAKEYTITSTGAKDTVFTGKQFNDILAGLGVVAGVPSSIDVRVTSSYGNNNEAYMSNVLTIKTTPYIVPITITSSSAGPITLVVDNAANSALVLNWNATQYGSFPFSYEVQMDTVGGNFTNPQVFDVNNGLTKDISVGDLNAAALSAGVTAGTTQKVEFRVLAFQGTNTIPSVISNIFKLDLTTYSPFQYLWVPGDYQGWSPGSAPQLAATLTSNDYEGYVNVPSGGSYEFKMTNAPDWNHTAYGGDVGTLSTSGGNLKWSDGGGYYFVKANPTALTWSATKATWAIIGDATPGGWGSDTQMTYDAVNKVWVINSVALSANSLKFRANGNWNDPNFPGGNSNLGGSLTGLSYNGSNIPVNAAGNYKVVLDLSHPLRYMATLTKL
ncbi:MAG: SusE domain-containing protein [Ginsengibacter sp.]